MNLQKLGILLKEKRSEMGLSLRDAANLVGVSHTYLSILEKAKDPRSSSPIVPTIETLQMISKAYNINTNILLTLAGYDDITINKNESKTHIESTHEFTTPEEAISFLLSQEVIMGFGGFDIDKLSDEDKIQFANELLGQLKLLSYKYKK